MKSLKRSVIVAASVLSGALLLSACGGNAAPAPTPAPSNGTSAEGEGTSSEITVETINYGTWRTAAPPVSDAWTHFLSENEEIQEKHSLDFNLTVYSNLQELYTDLAQGRVHGVSAGPSAMAANAAQGAPVRLATTIARSTARILSTELDWTADNLRGARMVAPTVTATWADVQLQIEKNFGLLPERDYELISTNDLAGPVAQVAAGTADFAMTWGEHVPNALNNYPNLQVVAEPSDLADGSNIPWQFTVTVHDSVSPEASARLVDAAEEVVEWMKANPEEVEAWAVGEGQTEGIATRMIEGIQTFEFRVLDDEIRSELEDNFASLVEMGRMTDLPPESFWGN